MNVTQRSAGTLRQLCRAASIAVVMAVAAPATAQMGGAAGLAELARHDYLHRDLVLFSQGLGLDDAQRMILDSLFDDYRQKFDAGWEKTQGSLANIREEVADLEKAKVLEVVMAPFEQWRHEKVRLKEDFESDVRTILSPQQRERWPQFTQQLTRAKTLHKGRLTGESLNLIQVVRDLRMSDREMLEMETMLDQYGQELHDALTARNSFLDHEESNFITSLRAHGAPPQSDISREMNTRIAVRNVNLRYIDIIAEQLPGAHADQFRARALEVANPRVFRTPPAMRTLSHALEIEDLDDRTRSDVQELHDLFAAELELTNSRIHNMMLDFEPKQHRNRAELMASRTDGRTVERLEDPTRDLFTERNARSRHYLEQLRGLLTPEQYASLPGTPTGSRVTAVTNDMEERAVGDRRQITRGERGALRRDQLQRGDGRSVGDGTGNRGSGGPSRGDTPAGGDGGRGGRGR